jgi:hypothetical protein
MEELWHQQQEAARREVREELDALEFQLEVSDVRIRFSSARAFFELLVIGRLQYVMESH